MSLLIADSGSTKTDWILLDGSKEEQVFSTSGMNPFFCTTQDYQRILKEELAINPESIKIDEIIFYGSGVKDASKAAYVERSLKDHFQINKVKAHSDILAAARASCANEKGVCCILGTGSNSAYYNGKKIMNQNPSLGFIVGDEGSGTHLGKKVIQYFFYNTFDDELKDAFQQRYGNNLVEILENIYQKPFANRYIASFADFLVDFRGHYMVENILEDAFIEFHQKHVLKYRESWKYPVHFVGSVAWQFKDIIEAQHRHYGLETGKILKAPKDGLAAFHKV